MVPSSATDETANTTFSFLTFQYVSVGMGIVVGARQERARKRGSAATRLSDRRRSQNLRRDAGATIKDAPRRYKKRGRGPRGRVAGGLPIHRNMSTPRPSHCGFAFAALACLAAALLAGCA